MYDSCGTPAYVAPEVLHKKGYYKEVDIWSTGVMLYTMLSRNLPFHNPDRKETFRMIKESHPEMESEPWQRVSEETKDLINQMLKKEPSERITIKDALKHKAFVKFGGRQTLSILHKTDKELAF